MEENEIIKHLEKEIIRGNFEALFILSDAFEELGNKACFAYRALYKLYEMDAKNENCLSLHEHYDTIDNNIIKILKMKKTKQKHALFPTGEPYFYYDIVFKEKIVRICIRKNEVLDIIYSKTEDSGFISRLKFSYTFSSTTPSGITGFSGVYLHHT